MVVYENGFLKLLVLTLITVPNYGKALMDPSLKIGALRSRPDVQKNPGHVNKLPLHLNGGSKQIQEGSGAIQQDHMFDERTLNVFYSSSFLTILSTALVAFSPAPALVEKIGTERATSILSILSALAALSEVILSSALGSLLDVVGRKSALIFTLIAIAIANGAVYLNPTVFTICSAKFIGSLCVGLFFIASQAIVSDISASKSDRMGSILGVQYSLIGAGFFVGAVTAGRLSEYEFSISYGSSSVVAALTTLLIYFGMTETLSHSKRTFFHPQKLRKLVLQSPLSCTNILFRHTKKVQMLAIILMLQSLPQFMGEVFQIFANTEWKLSTKDFSSLVAVFGFMNIFANTAGSVLVRKFGIRKYTAIATLSSMLGPIGATLLAFQGLLIGTIIGFLGSAQSLGVIAALVSEGAKSGLAQGELAGERSSFLAIFKVIGPILYSVIYVQGKRLFGFAYLPFIFNICLAVAALAISQKSLS